MSDDATPAKVRLTDGLGPTLTLVERLRSDAYALPSCGPWIERDGSTLPDNSCSQAADEIERLRAALKKANEQAERFERGWYLRGDALEVAVRQNEHDMLMTGDELRACRAALKETL